jgi:two-component system sensor histidine kinase/response regulator
MLGSKLRYATLLQGFVDDQANATRQIKAALVRGDQAVAERMAHTLKGLAGNIAATDLYQKSEQLEQLLRALAGAGTDAAAIDGALQRAQQALDTQVSAINMALASTRSVAPSSEPPPPAADSAQRDAVLRQLAELLRQDDPMAERLFAEHSALLASVMPQHFRALKQAIQGFALDEAHDILQEALTLIPLPEGEK